MRAKYISIAGLLFLATSLLSVRGGLNVPEASSSWNKPEGVDRAEDGFRLLLSTYRTITVDKIHNCAALCLKDYR